MPDAPTFMLFANHCRALASGAPTLAARDKYLDMALAYECEAQARVEALGTARQDTGSPGQGSNARVGVSSSM